MTSWWLGLLLACIVFHALLTATTYVFLTQLKESFQNLQTTVQKAVPGSLKDYARKWHK